MATDLLTLREAKNATEWKRFCILGQRETERDAEPRLKRALRAAEGELRDYVQVPGPAQLTPPLRRYLLRILRFNLFEIAHSAEDYDTKPTVLRRYESVIETLVALRDGTQPEPRDLAEGEEEPEKDVRVTAEPRRFRESWLPG